MRNPMTAEARAKATERERQARARKREDTLRAIRETCAQRGVEPPADLETRREVGVLLERLLTSADPREALMSSVERGRLRAAEREREKRAEARRERALARADIAAYVREHYGLDVAAQIEHYGEAGANATPADLLAQLRRIDIVPVGLIGAFIARRWKHEGDGVLSSIARRAGYTRSDGREEVTGLLRDVGLRPWLGKVRGDGTRYTGTTRVFIDYDRAVTLARAAGMEPYEAGV